MICFQKGIFIYPGSRGGLKKEKEGKKKRSILFSGLLLILEPSKCCVTEVSFGTSDNSGRMDGI